MLHNFSVRPAHPQLHSTAPPSPPLLTFHAPVNNNSVSRSIRPAHAQLHHLRRLLFVFTLFARFSKRFLPFFCSFIISPHLSRGQNACVRAHLAVYCRACVSPYVRIAVRAHRRACASPCLRTAVCAYCRACLSPCLPIAYMRLSFKC